MLTIVYIVPTDAVLNAGNGRQCWVHITNQPCELQTVPHKTALAPLDPPVYNVFSWSALSGTAHKVGRWQNCPSTNIDVHHWQQEGADLPPHGASEDCIIDSIKDKIELLGTIRWCAYNKQATLSQAHSLLVHHRLHGNIVTPNTNMITHAVFDSFYPRAGRVW